MAAERNDRPRPVARWAREGWLSYDGQWAVLIAILVVLDGMAAWVSFTLAYDLRITSGLLAYTARFDPAIYRQLTLAGVAIWLASLAFLGSYQRDVLMGGLGEYGHIIRASIVGVLGIITVSFFWRGALEPSRGWLLLVVPLSCLLLCAERFLMRRLAYALRRRGWLTARTLIVGANEQGIAIAEQWLEDRASGMLVVGFLDDFKPVGTPVADGLEVLGRPSALDAVARQTGAREVVLVSGAVAWESFEEIIQAATRPNGFLLRLSPGFYEMLGTGVVVTNKSFVPLLNVNEKRVIGTDAFLKMALDYGLGFPAFCLTLPLMGLIALGVKLAGAGGPLLDRHVTLGPGGATFHMLKFHTRLSRLPESGVPPTGARAFWLEKKLLTSGLDKSPQLFNLLAGQMALVGPRPRVLLDEATDPTTVRNLRTVKPGIIGPWTASTRWRQADEAQAELSYVRNWTIWLDLQILLETLVMWLLAGRPARLGSGEALTSGSAAGGQGDDRDGHAEAEHAARAR